MIVPATPAPSESVGMASTAMIVSASLASQGPSAMWRLMSARPALAAREAPAWMWRTASAASVHPAPCLHSAYPQAMPVPTSRAVMAFAMMHLAGSAVCASRAGVAPAAARAWLETPANPSLAGVVAPASATEWASTAPVPPESRAVSVKCHPPASQILVSMGAAVSLPLARRLSAPALWAGKDHDASRMWTSVPALHPVVPMAPVPTWQGVSAVPATVGTLDLPVIRTLTTVTPTRASMAAPVRTAWAPFPALAFLALLALTVPKMSMSV